MPEIGLFPLRLVLFPGERLPLHIFEPRYRELVGECIEQDEEFGILLAAEDGLRQVGTRVKVAEVLERLEDGRLNIIVEGTTRFRLVELTSGRAFHTGLVEPVVDDAADEAGDEGAAARALALLGELATAAGADIDLPGPGEQPLSFAIAARVELEAEDEQALLELRSEPGRLQRLAELLESAVAQAKLQREAGTRAKTNGHLPHTPQLP